MAKGGKDVEEILRTAMATEWEGFAFYSALSKRTKSREGREVFEKLAKDEVEHVRVLEQVSCAYKDGCILMTYEDALESIECDESLADVTEEALACKSTAPVFKRGVKRAESANDLEALKIGVESERSAIEFYRAAGKGATTDEARELFRQLVEIEEGHEALLQAEYDYYSANGFYMDAREFSLEG